MRLRVRPATADDLMLVFEWANDPVTRSMSFEQNSISLADHKEWFSNVLSDNSSPFLIIEGEKHEGNWVPIAQVRFSREGVINMSLDNKFRGQHLATPAIQQAIEYAKNTLNVDVITAYIKPENIASRKVFEKAGFHLQREATVKGSASLEYTYPL